MRTQQELFNYIAKHLLTQGCKAQLPRNTTPYGSTQLQCAYRGQDGTKCAVGCLIPDDRYDPSLEGRVLGDNPSIATAAGLETDKQLVIARALQLVHDMHEPEVWVEELAYVAEVNDLDTQVLEEFQ